MRRHLTMQHLHLGCGESLAQLLPEQPAQKAVKATPRLRKLQPARKPKKGGGR